ncbi:hypothetical protein EZV62_006925 [Acer yangbiense]|uniref:Uncharacterized protein n=1 Tax=Acer yangbiense TaxID=1000413 RepID=A0A5C7I8G9_9ROSI|nr:hypothetical protein EZV62_006925 [Acer yangbiense]
MDKKDDAIAMYRRATELDNPVASNVSQAVYMQHLIGIDGVIADLVLEKQRQKVLGSSHVDEGILVRPPSGKGIEIDRMEVDLTVEETKSSPSSKQELEISLLNILRIFMDFSVEALATRFGMYALALVFVFVFGLSFLVEWLSHCKLIRSGIFQTCPLRPSCML